MKKNFTLFPLCVVLIFSLSASAQNNAIVLDGTAGHINTAASVVPSSTNFTVELWAYVNAIASGQHYFVFQGAEGSLPFSIGYKENVLGSGAGDITVGEDPNTFLPYDTGIPMPVGQWVHIAVVFDAGSMLSTIYLNGVQQGAPVTSGYLGLSSSNLQISGQDPGTNTPIELIDGSMDELRVWGASVSDPTLGIRTATQIRAGLFGVDPTSPGLITYYKMDETSGNVIVNSANSTQTPAPPSSANGTWSAGASWAVSPIQNSSDNAISLNGVNDGITAPPNPAYDLSGGGTIEMWINPTTLSSDNSVLIAVRDTANGNNSRYSLHISNSAIALWTGSFTFFNYATPIPTGTWSHLAFVYNGTNATIVYLNGVSIGTLNLTFGAFTGLPLLIGNDRNTTESFNGAIDNVSIWSTQLTPAQIASTASGLVGNETGLVGLFNFNQGIPGGNNTGMRTVFDNTAAANDAILTPSMALSSTASNFVLSSITPLPVNFLSFTATAQDGQALLQWQTAQEQNSRDYSIERSADGKNYQSIGSVPAAGNSSLPRSYSFVDAAPLTGKNFYRLKESDLDNKFMYSEVRSLSFSATGQKLVWFPTAENSVEVDLLAGNNELYTVTDISGRTIQQGQLSSGKLYLSQLPGGIYVVKVTTATGTLTSKVFVK